MSNTIQANDVVLHKPTNEKWLVCGVSGECLVPCGYPFPSRAKIADCELIEKRTNPQTIDQANALFDYGMTGFIEQIHYPLMHRKG